MNVRLKFDLSAVNSSLSTELDRYKSGRDVFARADCGRTKALGHRATKSDKRLFPEWQATPAQVRHAPGSSQTFFAERVTHQRTALEFTARDPGREHTDSYADFHQLFDGVH